MKFLFAIILLSFLNTGHSKSHNHQEDHPTKAEELVHQILSKTAGQIKAKYNLSPCGVGVSMPGGPIQSLSLCFDTRDDLTKNDLRILVIKTAQELLSEIEKNSAIQNYLKSKPFTIKNIQIIIYNHDKNGSEVFDPSIATAQISKGILDYRTVDRQDTFGYKNKFRETYDEALKSILSDH